MTGDIERIVDAMETVDRALSTVFSIADAIADALSKDGRTELRERLEALRAENDAARERRRRKLADAARQGDA